MHLRIVKYWGWVWGLGFSWWGMFAGMWCCFVRLVCTDALEELATSCAKVREVLLRIAVGTRSFWFGRSSLEFTWRHLYICADDCAHVCIEVSYWSMVSVSPLFCNVCMYIGTVGYFMFTVWCHNWMHSWSCRMLEFNWGMYKEGH